MAFWVDKNIFALLAFLNLVKGKGMSYKNGSVTEYKMYMFRIQIKVAIKVHFI